VTVRLRIINHLLERLPGVSPESKNQIFAGRGRRLMLACHAIAFSLAELRKAKSVKFIGICIDFFICLGGTGREGDKCACGNSYTIGKRERAQRQTLMGI
jgi:hypothetical protein